MFCGKCGKKINDKAKFCKYCGAPIQHDVVPKMNHTPKSDDADAKNAGKKSKAKKLIIGACFIVAMIVVIAFNMRSDDLIGRWAVLNDDDLDYLEFLPDGTLVFEGEDSLSWDDDVTEKGVYWVEDDMLYIAESGEAAVGGIFELYGDYLDIYLEGMDEPLSCRRVD